MNKISSRLALFIVVMTFSIGVAYADLKADKKLISHGQYMVKISGCNNCHTPGYPQADGKTPMSDWLTGNPVGFNGPWGTTYPTNLRLTIQSLTEQQWLEHARKPRRPPMPWFSLRDMSDNDLRAIYAFIKNLGAKGQPAPDYTPPGQTVNTPYIVFMPQNLPKRPMK